MKNKVKTCICLSLLIMMTISLQAQNSVINDFYAKYKNQRDVMSLNIPGFLIRFGGSIATWEAEDEVEKAALELTKDIRNVRVLVGEGLFIERSEINQLIFDLQAEGFEELMTIRSQDTDINIVIREGKGLVRNILVVAEDTGEFTLVSLKTRLTLDQLSQVINQAIE